MEINKDKSWNNMAMAKIEIESHLGSDVRPAEDDADELNFGKSCVCLSIKCIIHLYCQALV